MLQDTAPLLPRAQAIKSQTDHKEKINSVRICSPLCATLYILFHLCSFLRAFFAEWNSLAFIQLERIIQGFHNLILQKHWPAPSPSDSVLGERWQNEMWYVCSPQTAIIQLEMDEMAWNKRQDQNRMVLGEKRLEYKFRPLYKEATGFSPHNRWIWKLWCYRFSIKCKIHDWKTIASSLISVSAILTGLRRQMFHSSLCLKLQIIAS